jgi:5'/3'-nucleotidase SurE
MTSKSVDINPKNGWLLLTNDDGIEALGFRLLVQALHQAGHAIIVFAPAENQSATSMSINLNTSMKLRQRSDLIEEWDLCNATDSPPIHLYELHGRPCDTIIVALDGGLQRLIKDIEPRLVISGVNLGPNLSQDSLHSGTMGAAREAGLYGMPAIASSFTSFEPEGIENAIAATVELVESALKVLPVIPQNRCRPHIDITANHISRWPEIPKHPAWESDPVTALRNAFRHGELMLNLNVPPQWDGTWATTRLGMRWYRNAVIFDNGEDVEGELSDETATFTIAGAKIDHDSILQGDCDAVDANKASISCMPTWPQTHPLALDDRLLTWTLDACDGGTPNWLAD